MLTIEDDNLECYWLQLIHIQSRVARWKHYLDHDTCAIATAARSELVFPRLG